MRTFSRDSTSSCSVSPGSRGVWQACFAPSGQEARRDCAATVLPLALLFFSGNAYYSFYTFFAGLILAAGMILRSQREWPFLKVNTRRLRPLLVIGFAALWLISIQLLPSLEFIPFLNKAQEIAGSHTPWQVFLDFTSKDWFRPDAYSSLPAKEEFYAYLGYTPFLALVGLIKPPQRTRRWIKPFALILGLTILWVALDYMPWREAFQDIEWLAQFRHLLRVLLFSGLALIILAAFGLESLWDRLKQVYAAADQRSVGTARLASGVLVAFMLLGPVDLFFTHSPFNRTQARVWSTYNAAAWLKQEDPGHYFVRYEPATDGHDALAATGHRFLEGWYHFTEIRSLNVDAYWNKRNIRPSPHYFIQFSGDPPPPVEGLVRIARTENRDVYRNPGALPFAFAIADATLLEDSSSEGVSADEVRAVEADWLDNATVQLQAAGFEDETLVLLLSHHPSWKAQVDEEPILTRNVSGLIGLPLQLGLHTYQLSFQPASFYLGLALSLGALAIVVSWIFFPSVMDLNRAGVQPGGQWKALRVVQDRTSNLQEGIRSTVNSATFVFSRAVIGRTTRMIQWLDRIASVLAEAWYQERLWIWSMGLALLVYAISRFIGIDRYPIYFFTDEAIQANLAADLIRDRFHGADGIFLPAYFKNVYEYNLSLSVYLQVLPTYFLGKTVLVTRMASALVTVFGAAAVGQCFSLLTDRRWGWLGVMLFGLMPAWFLHSRTAFETSLMVSMYAGFLYAYMLYSIRSPRYIFLAVLFASLTFYSYAPGQIIILTTSMFLLLIDRRAHWTNRRMLLLAIPLLVLLAIPYFRFQALLPGEHTNALRLLESHWVKEGSFLSKLTTSLGYYLHGLSPAYWFTPNVKDLVRHQVDAFGHLLLPTAPLFALGLVLAWRRRREPAARVVLIALFSIPTAGVLVGVGITRVLSLVIPFALLSGLALIWIYERVRERANAFLLAIATFFLLAGIQVGMLADALIRGPEYTDEYGMIGLQWGAQEVFGEIKHLQEHNPDLRVFLSQPGRTGRMSWPDISSPNPTRCRSRMPEPFLRTSSISTTGWSSSSPSRRSTSCARIQKSEACRCWMNSTTRMVRQASPSSLFPTRTWREISSPRKKPNACALGSINCPSWGSPSRLNILTWTWGRSPTFLMAIPTRLRACTTPTLPF